MTEERRAPVQSSRIYGSRIEIPAGTVSWGEHTEAWESYRARYGSDQSAERIAERGGFSYLELVIFLRSPPTTWRPR